MDKQKQIEEMAKDLGIAFQLAGTTRFGAVAEILVDKYQAIKQTRKETAEKFAEMAKSRGNDISTFEHRYGAVRFDRIDEICKEITEGNV